MILKPSKGSFLFLMLSAVLKRYPTFSLMPFHILHEYPTPMSRSGPPLSLTLNPSDVENPSNTADGQ